MLLAAVLSGCGPNSARVENEEDGSGLPLPWVQRAQTMPGPMPGLSLLQRVADGGPSAAGEGSTSDAGTSATTDADAGTRTDAGTGAGNDAGGIAGDAGLSAASDAGTSAVSDAGTSAASDAGMSAVSDAGASAASDAGTSPASDAGTSAVSDAGTSAVSDAGASAASDAGTGAVSDAGAIAASDGGPSAGGDAGASAASDAGMHAVSDAGTSAVSDAGASAASDGGPSAGSDAGTSTTNDAGASAASDAGTSTDAGERAGPLGAEISPHLALGIPDTSSVGNSTKWLLVRPQLATSYDTTRKVPNWTAWTLDVTNFGPATRATTFRIDPLLPTGTPQARDSDYTNSGFDRGHLCPSADRTSTDPDNDATFFLTNVVPQTHASNAGPWLDLEDEARTLANHGKRLVIIAGPIFGATTQTIGTGVFVPVSMFKVVVVLEGTPSPAAVTTSTLVYATIMPNTSVVSGSWRQWQVTIDDVEAQTGLDFLSDVDPAIQQVIERTRAP